MLDHMVADTCQLTAIASRLIEHFRRYGYRQVEPPIVEFAELFLRKSGAEVNARLYSFTDQGGRRVALRPELTASALRAFLQQADLPPLPARLSYAGPVFRYEKPQRGRYRQFTQVGVELIGAEPPLADAELLTMTVEAPTLFGLTNTRLVVGHLGVVLAFLAALEVDGRTQAVLLQSLESLKKAGERGATPRQLLHRQSETAGAALPELMRPPAGPASDPRVLAILAGMSRADAIVLVRSLLGSINTDVGGGRDPEEIVDRLLERLSEGDQSAKADRAIEFILELSRLAGPRDVALSRAADLIGRYGLSQQPLQELTAVCELLDATGFDWSNVTIDLSLGRGLQYYTGLVFELYGVGLGTEDQICGGGRYDGLARSLGSKRDLPAIGCSFGLERLKLLCETQTSGALAKAPDALVVPTGDAVSYAFEVAAALRCHGLCVELEVRKRGLRASLDFASRQGTRWVLIAGERERGTRTVVARLQATGREVTLPLASIKQRGLADIEETAP